MIETERLILRPFREEDIELVYRIYSDPEILHFTPYDTRNRKETEEFLEKIIRDWKETPPESLEMAILLKGTGEEIGRAGIHRVFEEESAMVGYYLLKPFRGRGLATEAAEGMIRYCFKELGLHRVFALCNPGNPPTCRVLERCGMRREACLKGKTPYRKKEGLTWEDELVYGILRSEWEERQR